MVGLFEVKLGTQKPMKTVVLRCTCCGFHLVLMRKIGVFLFNGSGPSVVVGDE